MWAGREQYVLKRTANQTLSNPKPPGQNPKEGKACDVIEENASALWV